MPEITYIRDNSKNGHADSVNAIASSGDYIATASDDTTIKVFKKTADERMEYQYRLSCFSSVNALLFLEDGNIVSGDNSGNIEIWDKKEQKSIQRFKAESLVLSLAVLEDGNIVSGDRNGNIEIWDKKEQKSIQRFKAESLVRSLAVLEDGNIVSGDDSGNIEIWDKKEQKRIQRFKAEDSVRSLAILEDGNIVSGDSNGNIEIWDKKEQKSIQRFKAESWVLSLAVLEDGNIVSGDDSGNIEIWDKKEQKSIDKFKVNGSVTNLILVNSKVYYSTSRGDVGIYKNKSVKTFDSEITALVFQDNRLIVSTKDGDIFYFEVDFLGVTENKDILHRASIKTLFLGNGRSGKSTLAFRLAFDAKCKNLNSTHGMHILRHNFGEMQKDEKRVQVELLLWDFAGQEEYQLAHQQSYENSKIIFLVIDLSKERKEDKSNHFWVERINKNAPKEAFVFVVGVKGVEDKARLKEISKDIKRKNKSLFIDALDEKGDGIKLLNSELKRLLEKSINFTPYTNVGVREKSIDKIFKRRANSGYLSIHNLEKVDEDILTELEESDEVEKIGSHYLLRPHWRNVVATSIYRHARGNETINGAISKEHLFGADNLSIDFDKTYHDDGCEEDREKIDEEMFFINDDEIFKKEKENIDFFKELLTITTKEMITKYHAYEKLNMFIFPSRFTETKDEYNELSGYFKLNSYELLSRQNSEEAIGSLVVMLHLSGKYRIIKHLYHRVMFRDEAGDEYWLSFEREKSHNHSQSITALSLYAKKDTQEAKEFLKLITFLIEDRMLPVVKKFVYENSKKNQRMELFSDEPIKEKDGFILQKQSFEPQKDILRSIKERAEKNFKDIKEQIRDYEKKPLGAILHLSDLHIDAKFDIDNQIYLLKKDLIAQYGEDFKSSISLICLSGDISNRAEVEEFILATEFIEKLCEFCDVSAEDILLVAGNHDYNRKLSHQAYEISADKSFNRDSDFKIDDKHYLKRKQSEWEKRFAHFSNYLYEFVYNQPFKTGKKEQMKIMKYSNDGVKIAFVLLNSAYYLDHFKPNRVEFDEKNVTTALRELEDVKYKFFVAHHPIDNARDYDFIANLFTHGVTGFLHGHLHRNMSVNVTDIQQGIDPLTIIGAGSFSVDGSHQIDGVTLKYNLISIEEKKIVIKTRQRENRELMWEEACIYITKGKQITKNGTREVEIFR